MRTVRLRLESLTVDSFDTTVAAAAAGTVVAHQMSRACSVSCEASCIETACCPSWNTCHLSCNGTCVGYSCEAATCVGTCATCEENTCVGTCGC